MADDIRSGDVVVCLRADQNTCHYGGGDLETLVAGRFYHVVAVTATTTCDDVYLAEIDGAVCPGVLRKIDAPKTELSERIRACRPTPAKEPA